MSARLPFSYFLISHLEMSDLVDPLSLKSSKRSDLRHPMYRIRHSSNHSCPAARVSGGVILDSSLLTTTGRMVACSRLSWRCALLDVLVPRYLLLLCLSSETRFQRCLTKSLELCCKYVSLNLVLSLPHSPVPVSRYGLY